MDPPSATTVLLPSGSPAPPLPVVPLDAQEGRYALQAEVGRGGMGSVHKAEDRLLGRKVALKRIQGADEAELEARFLREARLTSQLDHAAVLPVYDLGRDAEGSLFFSMKLVSRHQTLEDVIDKLRAGDPDARMTYTFQRRVQLIQRVCEALSYAHQRGVIHRDIKPANVVLSRYGEVFLADWGIAKAQEDEEPEAPAVEVSDEIKRPISTGSTFKTEAGRVIGTVAYMAPETLALGESTPQTDVYSLCAVLYELLTLNYYLGEVDPKVILHAIVQRDPEPADQFTSPTNGRVPRELAHVCALGLHKDPEQRIQSAQELEQRLQLWLEGSSPIVCAGTCMKRVLSTWSHAVDRRPFVVPVLSFCVFALFLRWLVVTAQDVWTLFAS